MEPEPKGPEKLAKGAWAKGSSADLSHLAVTLKQAKIQKKSAKGFEK